MIDKARAVDARTLGGYFKYPCPIDRRCLELLGVSPKRVSSIATSAESGQHILLALESIDANLPAIKMFDPVGMNRSLHSTSS